MKKHLVIIGLIVLLGIIFFVQSRYFKNTTEYQTREECEKATNEPCQRDFGDYVLPSDPEDLKKARDCINKIPHGWAPKSAFPNCTWPI